MCFMTLVWKIVPVTYLYLEHDYLQACEETCILTCVYLAGFACAVTMWDECKVCEIKIHKTVE